jgi:hypothetical protein
MRQPPRKAAATPTATLLPATGRRATRRGAGHVSQKLEPDGDGDEKAPRSGAFLCAHARPMTARARDADSAFDGAGCGLLPLAEQMPPASPAGSGPKNALGFDFFRTSD